LLLITGTVETPAERIERALGIIRARCAGYLSSDDLSLILKPAAPPIPKAKPATKRPG
jgi:hypothetical protein